MHLCLQVLWSCISACGMMGCAEESVGSGVATVFRRCGSKCTSLTLRTLTIIAGGEGDDDRRVLWGVGS